MIRFLLSLSVMWWLCFYFYPVETLVAYAVIVACIVREAAGAAVPKATARRLR